MSDAKPTKPPSDELTKQLKETLVRRRPKPAKIVLVTLAVSVVFLVGLAYFLYNGPRLPPLQVLAFDVVAVEGESPAARVQLFSNEPETPLTALRRKSVVIQEPRRVNQPDANRRLETLQSDDAGQAEIDWSIGKETIGEFLASYVNFERQHASVNDRGLLFVWPAATPIVIVAADEALIADELNAEAGTALMKASTDGWRVIYVCTEQTAPAEFVLARQWLRRQPRLPRGPVLGPRHPLETPASEESRREIFASLEKKFTGPKLAIVKSPATARIAKDARLPTTILGDAKDLPGVQSAATWADVAIKRK